MTIDLLRPQDGQEARTTTVELFFDLVYAFAITQLSSRLLDHPTATGALEAALLLGMVWQIWSYTTWVTNWLDPSRLPVRIALLVLMAGSLILSVGIPEAYGSRGPLIGGAYAFAQIGRSVFCVFTMGRGPLQRNFQRILCWCLVSGGLAVLGAAAHGHLRVVLWVGAVAVDALGGLVGFWTPVLGRTPTTEWTIDGTHFADRCQAFLLIALGEGIVRIGESLSEAEHLSGSTVSMFVAVFVGTALLWWVYFDRSAEDATRVLISSRDPGRLGRSAYHFLHPVMIAGIVVTAAADQRVIEHPSRTVDGATAWMMLGGTALYLLGHSLFKIAVWRRLPLTRLVAIAVLAALGLAATHLDAWQLGGIGDVVLAALVVSDRWWRPSPSSVASGAGTGPGPAPA